MKKYVKRVASLLLCSIIVFGIIAIGGNMTGLLDLSDIFGLSAFAAETSGTCGDNLTWSFDESTGTLEISGTGDFETIAYKRWINIRDSIKNVQINSGATSISDKAFLGCKNLTKIDIPESVTAIGAEAFSNCRSLIEITLPESIKNIGDRAFFNCSSLKSIEIPRGVTSIGLRMFCRCTSLESAIIPDSVKIIGDYAFEFCSSLKSITIPGSVKSIGKDAFRYCYELTGITLVDGIENIGQSVFSGCRSLLSIEIPKSIKLISNSAFAGCSSLTKVVIQGALSIGEDAFSQCSKLETLMLPVSISQISTGAFNFCKENATIFYAGTGEQWKKISKDYGNNDRQFWKSCRIIYECNSDRPYSDYGSCGENAAWKLYTNGELYISGKGIVDTIGLKNVSSVTKVTISEGVTSIGERTFKDYTSLTSISIPNTVDKIGASAFENTGLYNDDTNWDSGILYIGKYLIKAKKTLSGECIIKPETEIIVDAAFSECSELEELNIPDGLKNIGNRAFADCVNLRKVTIPASLKIIGDAAFSKCSELIELNFLDGLTNIGNRAFADCVNLRKVTIPTSLKIIGDNAFDGCRSDMCIYYLGTGEQVKSIKIGVGENRLKNPIICECNSDNPYYLPGSCGEALAWTLYIDGSLVIDGTGEMTKWDGLVNKGNIKTVLISQGATSISYGAFSDCEQLETITISDTVTKIDAYAFDDCSALSKVYYTGTPEQWKKISISSGNSLLTDCEIIYINDSDKPYYNSGMCGNNLTWKFYTDGELVISGTGEMWEYSAPWDSFRAKIKTLTLSPGLTSISCEAFSGCSATTNVSIPNSVTKINGLAFANCTALASVNVPNSVTKIGYRAFYNTEIYNDESNWIDDVLYIGNYLIEAKESLTGEYEIKAGTRVIAHSAFAGCSDLSGIIVPESVVSIGESAFYECAALTSIKIPNGVTEVCGNTFENCTNLKSVSLPNGITKIGHSAFFNCQSLVDITVPNEVTTIGGYAFYNCKKIRVINISKTVTDIGDNAFALCRNLAEITVDPMNPIYISEDGVLFNKEKTVLLQFPCSKESAVYVIPDGVTEINEAFWGCSNVKKIIIPSGIVELDNCFTGCSGLEYIEVDESNSSFSSDEYGVLYNKDKTSLLHFPQSLKTKEYFIPNSVVELEEDLQFLLCYCDGVEKFVVDENNKYYSSDEQGVLYNKEKTSIIKYPAGRKSDTYIIPASVNNPEIYGPALSGKYLQRFEVADGNEIFYTDKNGFLFFAYKNDASALLKIPNNTPLTFYEVPEAIDIIQAGAFGGLNNLKKVHVSPKYSSEELVFMLIEDDAGLYYYDISDTIICSDKEPNSYRSYSILFADFFELCDGHHDEHVHIVEEVLIPASCTIDGMKYKICSECGEALGDSEVIKATGHTSGDWIVVTEPTADTDGKRVKKCTVCGTILSEEILPKLTVAVDEKTGIGLVYSGGDYSGKVELSVEEVFDGAAFNLVNTQFNVSQSFIYDIKMTVDGVETQPTGTVKVRIPLPEGFDPARTFVYHVDTETGKVVKMAATYKDGYLEFETDHFSYYAVVEEAKPCKLSINTPSVTTVSYGFTLNLHANVTDLPEGARVVWSMDGSGFELIPSADGMTCGVKSVSKGSATITAKVVDKNGNAVKDANGNEITASQQLTSKAGFFQKLAAFFKKLFGSNMVIPYALKELIK